MLKRSNLVLISVLAVLTLFAVAACAEGTENPFGTTTPVPTEDASSPGSSNPEPSGPDVANGETKFTGLGCSGCHTTDSSKRVGPGLAGIAARGDEYIRTSITDPAAELVEGYANLMPTSFASLKQSDLDDLVAYLKTLN